LKPLTDKNEFQKAENTLRINFTGTLNVSNAFFKLLRPHARVVNVSSRAGNLKGFILDPEVVAKLSSEKTTVEDIVKIADNFVE
jgi:carbonyl reductase 1